MLCSTGSNGPTTHLSTLSFFRQSTLVFLLKTLDALLVVINGIPSIGCCQCCPTSLACSPDHHLWKVFCNVLSHSHFVISSSRQCTAHQTSNTAGLIHGRPVSDFAPVVFECLTQRAIQTVTIALVYDFFEVKASVYVACQLTKVVGSVDLIQRNNRSLLACIALFVERLQTFTGQLRFPSSRVFRQGYCTLLGICRHVMRRLQKSHLLFGSRAFLVIGICTDVFICDTLQSQFRSDGCRKTSQLTSNAARTIGIRSQQIQRRTGSAIRIKTRLSHPGTLCCCLALCSSLGHSI